MTAVPTYRYDYVIAENAEIPFIALVFGEDSANPGDTLFQFRISDLVNFEATVAGIEDLWREANARNVVLDHLCEFDITPMDLFDLIRDVQAGVTPYPRPETFTSSDLDAALENAVCTTPAELSEYAVSAALKELVPNWKQALDEGSDISELVGDIDAVISRLEMLKRFCTVRGAAQASSKS